MNFSQTLRTAYILYSKAPYMYIQIHIYVYIQEYMVELLIEALRLSPKVAGSIPDGVTGILH
jgi:hypothetical protein